MGLRESQDEPMHYLKTRINHAKIHTSEDGKHLTNCLGVFQENAGAGFRHGHGWVGVEGSDFYVKHFASELLEAIIGTEDGPFGVGFGIHNRILFRAAFLLPSSWIAGSWKEKTSPIGC